MPGASRRARRSERLRRRPRGSGRRGDRPLRVTHCPVNMAGIPWENVRALRRKGVEARLVVFNRGQAPPRGRLVARPARRRCPAGSRRSSAPWRGCCPQTDVFHFYFGLDARAPVAPVPDPARDAQEERLPLPRLGHPRQDARRARPTASGRTPRSSAPTPRCAGCPRPTSSRPASTCASSTPAPPSRQPRGRSSCTRPRTATRRARSYVIEACAQLPGRPRDRRGRRTTRRRARATPAPTSSSTS